MKKNHCFFREWKIPEMQKALRVMKLTIFLTLLSAVGLLASTSYSQTKMINLNVKNSTVKEVLQNVEAQSEYYFMYSEKLIDVKREVSIDIKSQKISEVLDVLFAGTGVTYKVKDRLVLLTSPELSGANTSFAQQVSVSGRVTDKSGAPVPGVTITVKSTARGTVTGTDGR